MKFYCKPVNINISISIVFKIYILGSSSIIFPVPGQYDGRM